MMICPATVFLGTCTDKALLSGGVLNYSTRLNLYVKGADSRWWGTSTC